MLSAPVCPFPRGAGLVRARGESIFEAVTSVFGLPSANRPLLQTRSLALAEMNLALAALAIRVLPHATLYETTYEDVLYDHDMFIPRAKKGSKGVRVKIN